MPSAIQEILRTGRDPNDSYWVTVRYADDWSNAIFDRTMFDVSRHVVELEPTSLIFGPENWLPLEPAVDALGNAYRADRGHHLLLRKLFCENEFRPVACLGGHGWQTGQFDHPAGVTVDCRGWLLVADAGNHRVQVIQPEDPTVIAVLGQTDHWGHYVSGNCGGAMVEPVQAVCDPATYKIYVADREGGLIHIFDERFEYECSFVPDTVSALGSAALPDKRTPVALTIAEDGSLWVLDAFYPRIMRMTTEGEPLSDTGMSAGQANPFPGGRALRPRYQVSGEFIVGPLDSGVYNQTWHKIGIESEIPEGASAQIQSFASNDAMTDIDGVPIGPLTGIDGVAWAPIEPVPVRAGETAEYDCKPERLVLSDTQAWQRHRHGEYTRAKPDLHTFTGDGPSSSNTFTLPHTQARRLRGGDTIELDTGAATEDLIVAQVSPTRFRAYANGVAKVYPHGSEIWLEKRDDRTVAGGARLLHTLAPGEVVDLSAAVMNDRLTDVVVPHGFGAVARIGDRLALRHADDVASLEIESLDRQQPHTVTTNVAVAGDYSNSTLRLSITPGRLVCNDVGGFEYQPPRHTAITIDSDHAAQVALVEPDVATIWLEPGSGVDFATWQGFETAEPTATDRGRYLWVRLQLYGALRHAGDETAIATPTIHSIAALTPRPSYLTLLPALYSRSEPRKDPVGSLFLERFLALFEGRLTNMESLYERFSSLLNIETTNEEWLNFLSTWMGLVLDPSWDAERRRQLLLEVMDLYQKRGTREGLSRYLTIYTGKQPVILEGYQWRPSTSMVIGRIGRLGCSALKAQSCDYEPYAHRFGLHVFVEDASEPDVVEAAVRNIIDSVKPAHTDYDLMMALPETRVGCQSRVGIDMVLADRPVHPFYLSTPDPSDEPHSIVGRSSLARNPSASDKPGGVRLDVGGIQTTGMTLN